MDRKRIEADVREALHYCSTESRCHQVAVHCEQLLAALAEAEAEIARMGRAFDEALIAGVGKFTASEMGRINDALTSRPGEEQA